jgi:hypothetical protein
MMSIHPVLDFGSSSPGAMPSRLATYRIAIALAASRVRWKNVATNRAPPMGFVPPPYGTGIPLYMIGIARVSRARAMAKTTTTETMRMSFSLFVSGPLRFSQTVLKLCLKTYLLLSVYS